MKRILVFAILMTCSVNAVFAEEGMWLYSNPPKDAIEQKYGFTLTPEWLDNLQKASIRFGNGGSASFVSPNGLVMTNHHVGVSTLQRMSTSEHDYVQNGYYAKTEADELECPGVELNVLQEIRDVSERVKAAVRPGMTGDAAEQARRAAMSTIEEEANKETGLKCEVATFFNGGLYHLYCYKKYTEVRLVFAPESAIGFFGGDPDNFEYPRYCLDVTFFRAYEDGKPAQTPNYLKLSATPAAEGDLMFVSGHPGRTNRFKTVAELKFYRDKLNPYGMEKVYRKEVTLKAYGERSDENMRQVHTEIFRWTNYRKVRLGVLSGLQDDSLMTQKEAEEKALRNAITQARLINPRMISPWLQIERALQQWETIMYSYDLLEAGEGFNTQAFSYAKTLVRVAQESQKPNANRLREYSETAIPGIKQALEADTPSYEEVEIVKLADSLGLLIEKLGNDDPVVKQVLAGKSPQDRAAELIKGTTLFDKAKRLELLEGGLKAINASDDPMINVVLAIDKRAREVRGIMESRVEEPMRQAYTQIADARFKLYGTSVYPDATFTLRLAYGVVKGITDANGNVISPMTEMGGTFAHGEAHKFIDPYTLPETWVAARDKIKPSTPMNMITTNDIIGGNSGSPMVNKNGEVVGLIFDGNRESLVLNFIFEEKKSRAVSVCATAILEALQSIYQTDRLLEELKYTMNGKEMPLSF